MVDRYREVQADTDPAKIDIDNSKSFPLEPEQVHRTNLAASNQEVVATRDDCDATSMLSEPD